MPAAFRPEPRQAPAVTFRRLTVRRLAAHVLLVWLFALTSGVVNACVIVPGAHGPVDVAGHAGHPALPHDAGCGHAHDPGDGRDAPPPACAKFCADGSSSVTPAPSVFNAGLGIDVALVPTMALAGLPPDPGVAVEGLAAAPPAAPVPIAIAFRRLTR